MTDKPDINESMLLDWHLGQLDDDERQRVERALADSPELVQYSERLQGLLKVLDADAEPVPPANLVENVMTRIQERTKVIQMPAATSGQEVAARFPSLALRDIIAIAACITLFIGIAIPGYFKVHNVSQRRRCLSNMRTVSNAMTDYSQAHAGFLPYVDYVKGGTWLPEQNRDKPQASNTRHVYKLVREGYLPNTRVFLCPADKHGRPMQTDDYQQFADFVERINNSYSYVFMNWPHGIRLEQMRHGPGRSMVLIADRNPHFYQGSGKGPRTVSHTLSNSPLHEGGAGQNAIYVDGHGGWYKSPNIGVNGDDIYKAGSVEQYQGTEQPVSETDTFLP